MPGLLNLCLMRGGNDFVVTLFVHQRLTAHLHAARPPPYVINLDPAVHEVPFPANIGEEPLIWLVSGHSGRSCQNAVTMKTFLSISLS